MEDGTDIQAILNQPEDKESMKEGGIKKYPKKVSVNVNKYVAKYNFEIARKLKGSKLEVVPPLEK